MARRKTTGDRGQREKLKEMVRELGIQDASELYAALRDIFSDTLEEMLQSELDEHLGYEKYEHGEKPTGNRRNGNSTKTVISQAGQMELKLPRDRDGSFEPQVVKKGQKDISQIEEKILSMYAKGMSERDISATVEDIYGFSVSHDTISRIVDRIQPRLSEWQSRPLEAVYPFVYVDAMMVKVKQDGKARNKAVYTVIGVDLDGHKDILGLWIAEKEGAHFWMLVFDEMKARGVQAIQFVCIDGLPGLEEGISNIFPMARIQRCMVHLVRNSLKYIPSKHYKAFCKDAKAIYGAASLSEARDALEWLHSWAVDYPAAVRVWVDNFEHVERLFDLPNQIRRIVYTTNMVESVHSALRKVTRGKSAFPNDMAVLKALFLRTMDLTKKWSMPIPNWALVLGQLDILP